MTQLLWAGYRFGVGNQAIQIVFLKHLLDPARYASDALLHTLPHYPTLFFRLLAPLARLVPLEPLYFTLHMATLGLTAIAVFLLSRAMFTRTTSAFAGLLLLVAGHHQALAGAPLYAQAFTHTGVGYAVAIFCLALYFRGRFPMAFALAGLLMNIHALQGMYVAAFLVLGLAVERRTIGWRRAVISLALLLALAAPSLMPLLLNRADWDATWLSLLRVRSAAHSFPLTWWQPGHFDIPRFMLAATLGILALGFGMPDTTRLRIKTMLAAGLLLFAIGVAASGIWPLPIVLRAQVFRTSAFLLLVFLLTAAHGTVSAWRAALSTPNGGPARLAAWADALATGFAFVVLALPGFEGLWTAAVAAVALTALLRSRLSSGQAAMAGGALLVAALASASIRFPFISRPTGFDTVRHLLALPDSFLLPPLLAAALLATRLRISAPRNWALRTAFLLACAALLYRHYTASVAVQDADDPWIQAQQWSRQHTPPDATFLTPPMPGGFRVHSERAVVAEWRDGTQQYFDPIYAAEWERRMRALAPGLIESGVDGPPAAAGRDLAEWSDDELEALARRFGATYLVLPASQFRDFVPCWENSDWAIYRGERRPPPPPPADAVNAAAWRAQEEFMAGTVRPNIERHRKNDVTLQVVDRDGRPLRGLPIDIRQIDSLFRFGSALGYFARPPDWQNTERSAYIVDPRELERMAEIFNFSVTGYSGKWLAMEPQRDNVFTNDMDRYVAWCREHRVRVQFHFVTGYEPAWFKGLDPAEKERRLVARARALAERYGNDIESWQVMNEKHLYAQAPAAFRALREALPTTSLGISDCAVFWSKPASPKRQRALHRGLPDQIDSLRKQGIAVDFVGLHGHRPFGLWADLREVYAMFDSFARDGVRVYVTEFGTLSEGTMEGPVRTGKWTEALQADYYELMFSICFSHPAVDGINLWGVGPRTFVPGAGLLDENYQPKPAFLRLKTLIRDTWRTRFHGRSGVDGSVAFRGFHGDYEAQFDLGDGRKATALFRVPPGPPVRVRMTVDRIAGTATIEGPTP